MPGLREKAGLKKTAVFSALLGCELEYPLPVGTQPKSWEAPPIVRALLVFVSIPITNSGVQSGCRFAGLLMSADSQRAGDSLQDQTHLVSLGRAEDVLSLVRPCAAPPCPSSSPDFSSKSIAFWK